MLKIVKMIKLNQKQAVIISTSVKITSKMLIHLKNTFEKI